MATPTTSTELLKSHGEELVKQFIELDGQERPWKVYTAKETEIDGGACVVTEYEYKDIASTVIIKRKEYYGNWVTATMDI